MPTRHSVPRSKHRWAVFCGVYIAGWKSRDETSVITGVVPRVNWVDPLARYNLFQHHRRSAVADIAGALIYHRTDIPKRQLGLIGCLGSVGGHRLVEGIIRTLYAPQIIAVGVVLPDAVDMGAFGVVG